MMTIPTNKCIGAVVAVFGLLVAGCAEDGARTDEGSMQQVEIVDVQPEMSMPDAASVSPPSDQATRDQEATVEITSVVDVMVVGVTGYAGGELAGVVMQEADGLVVGGFATKIVGDPFTTSQPVLLPAGPGQLAGPWPHVADEPAVLPPGDYVLTLWADTGLGGYTRWFPMNSDGRGLAGCVQQFSVGDEAVTKVVVGGDVRSTGYVGMCEPGFIIDDSAFAPAPVEVVVPDRTSVTPPFAGAFDGDGFGMVQELLVWQDEFLAIGRLDGPRPLPSELPAEIAEQFPPEIQDLFPDGLPPTVQEAFAVIEEADMMSEVTDALSSIPGADEAIFGLGPMPPSWLFARSVDGSEWEQFDVNLPEEIVEILDVAASGDRLVVVGHRPPVDGSIGSSEVVVAWSDDLVSWTTARLAPERPDDLPEGAVLEIWQASTHANELGWMVDTFVGVNLGDADVPDDPSPELARYLEDGGWGLLAPASTLWFSSWGGEPAITMPVASEVSAAGGSVVVATRTGFIHLSGAVRYTDDGMTWETRSVLATNGMAGPWSAATQLIPDGFVVVLDRSPADAVVYRVDDGGEQWVQLEIPDLPNDLWSVPRGNGYLFDSNGWDESFEQWILATPDGERWYLEQYNSFDPAVADDGYEPRVAAFHDDTLLVGGAFVDVDWWAIAF